MNNELLPCPFCGHDEPTHDEGDESAWVQCTNGECGMCGPMASGPSLAAAAWNRRATQPAAGEPKWSCLNAWFLSLEPGRQAVLREEKWMLAGAAFDAGRQCAAPPAAAHGDEVVRKDAERYRWLSGQVTEVALGGWSELYTDNRRAWKLPLLLSQNAVGVETSFGRAIDAAMRAQAGEGGE